MSNTSKEMSGINSDVDAVTEGINRVVIIDSKVQICANCGKEGSDVTNTCNKCKLVMYCNAACKKKHRKKHKKECEENVKRAAEHEAKEHDKKLFKQPPPEQDCPICMIRLPTLSTGRTYKACCGKVICCGCINAVVSISKGHPLCPYCRTPVPTTDEEIIKRYKQRSELNDAMAIQELGFFYASGLYGVPQNSAKALELFHRAGELGHTRAYHNVAYCYTNGINGLQRDEKKIILNLELAAMGGHVSARFFLGAYEQNKGNRALKHYMIAIEDGDSDSLEEMKKLFMEGNATKDDYANALRSYQAYLDEVKSDQRDKAAVARDEYKYYESAF